MKHLCIVRHGSYNFLDGHLAPEGKDEAFALGAALRKTLGLVQPIIVSSDSIRSMETAGLIAERFGATVSTQRFLSDEIRPSEMAKVYNLVRHYERQNVANLIFVTHELQATFFPPYFADQVFGLSWEQRPVREGTGWIIDCEAKTLKRIP